MAHPHPWRKPSVLLGIFIVLLSGVFIIVYYLRSGTATTIILVRHAEKNNEPDNPNPSLSAEGMGRAQTLVHVLANAGVTRIYATQYERTQQTVKPLADRLGLPINEVNARSTAELVSQVKSNQPGGVILIAGHSNSVPEIIVAIGGEQPPEIPDNEYDNLFVMTVSAWGNARVVRLKYGSSGASQ